MHSTNNKIIIENTLQAVNINNTVTATSQNASERVLGADTSRNATCKDEMYPPKPNIDSTVNILMGKRVKSLAAEGQIRKKRLQQPVAQIQVKKRKPAEEQIRKKRLRPAVAQVQVKKQKPAEEQMREETRALPALAQLQVKAPRFYQKKPQPSKKITEAVIQRLKSSIDQLTTEGLKYFDYTIIPSRIHARISDCPISLQCTKILKAIRTKFIVNSRLAGLTPDEYANKLGIVDYVQNKLRLAEGN